MPEILKGLALDRWFKVLIWLGVALMVLGLIGDTKALTNKQAFTLGAGLFLVGLGEWKSVVHKSAIKPPNAYTGPAAFMKWTEREPDGMARSIMAAGYLCLLVFVVELAR